MVLDNTEEIFSVGQHWKVDLDLNWAFNFAGGFPTWKVLPSWGRLQCQLQTKLSGSRQTVLGVTIYLAPKFHHHHQSVTKEWDFTCQTSGPSQPWPFGEWGCREEHEEERGDVSILETYPELSKSCLTFNFPPLLLPPIPNSSILSRWQKCHFGEFQLLSSALGLEAVLRQNRGKRQVKAGASINPSLSLLRPSACSAQVSFTEDTEMAKITL